MTKLTPVVAGPFETNTWIVFSESAEGQKLFIVDAGGSAADFAALADRLPIDPCGLVLTHGHLDHLSLIPSLLQRYPSLPVYIHEADSCALGPDGYEYHHLTFRDKGLLGWVHCTQEETGVIPAAAGLLHDGDRLPFAPAWKVLHTPGHTRGCICLYNEEEHLLISGDTLFQGTCGRTDMPDSSTHDMKLSLQRLLQLPPETCVFPGHGETTTIGAETETYCFL